MAPDPRFCVIPPGFEVIGGFSDDFDKFKDTTNYSKFKDPSGIVHGLNFGVSKRWKNSNIESVNIVCGFQFRIGPDEGTRWNAIQQNLGKVKSGDVNLHFPRLGGDKRGGYIVKIKWFANKEEGGGFLSEARLEKEYPHNTYGPRSGEPNYFLQEQFRFRGQKNPDSPLLSDVDIHDGEWHSFLGVIFNDYYFGKQNVTIGEPSPTIGLWYKHVATETQKFEDFNFIGMSIDKRGKTLDGTDSPGMFPNGPLVSSVENFDEPFKIEHALQIRIDDVPSDQIELRNVYTANVIYHGAIPPPNPTICIAEAKAVNDAQAKVDELNREKSELAMDLGDLQGKALEERRSKIDFYRNSLIPQAKSDLSTAKFNYGECANIGFRRRKIPVIHDEGFACEPLEKKRDAAHAVVKRLEDKVQKLSVSESQAHTDSLKKKFSDAIDDIVNNKLPPARVKLAAAQKALDDCLNPSVHL